MQNKGKLRSEKGYAFVEASVVFPIALLSIFFLLFAGDMFYQKAWLSSTIASLSVNGANAVSDPISKQISDSAPSNFNQSAHYPDSVDMKPFRWMNRKSMTSDPAQSIADELQRRIIRGESNIFGIRPINPVVKAETKMPNFTVSLEYGYRIPLPDSFGGNEIFGYSISSTAMASSVSDTEQMVSTINYFSFLFAGGHLDQNVETGLHALKAIAEPLSKFLKACGAI